MKVIMFDFSFLNLDLLSIWGLLGLYFRPLISMKRNFYSIKMSPNTFFFQPLGHDMKPCRN